MTKLCAVLALTGFAIGSPLWAQESIPSLSGEWRVFGMITGYHSFFDKTRKWEMRLLEADGSATVAHNPIGLFVVVTNNSSGPDLQEQVWRLPKGVEKVQKATPLESGLEISALGVGGIDEKTQKAILVPKIITVKYEIRNGILADQLVVGLR